MAGAAPNFSLYTYLDQNGVNWNKRGEKDAVRNAVDGSAAAGAHPAWGRETTRKSVRKIVYEDLTTGRTRTIITYTPTADAAITLQTSTLSFPIQGEATAVVYTAVKRIAERQPKAAAGLFNLPEHA
jgi:hypothetical protein